MTQPAPAAELYVLLRKAGAEPYTAQDLIDAHAAAIRTAAGQDQPTTDRTALRDRITTAIGKWHRDPEQPLYEQGADAVLAVLPEPAAPAGQDQPHERRERWEAVAREKFANTPGVWDSLTDAYMAVADAEQRELRAELSAAYEEANELALHNDATCETVKERDGLLAERDRLRAELAQARGAAFIEGAVAVAADTEYGFATDYAGRHEALLRRMATEAQQAGHPQPEEPTL